MIGGFFNNILPGVIGGDAVKVYYLYKDTRNGGSSLGSVFMDRYTGFFALLLIGLFSGGIAYNELKSIGMNWAMPALFVIFILGSLFLFGVRIGRRFAAIADFYNYFHRYLKKKKIMLQTFILSIIIQVVGLMMVYCIALGLDQKPSFAALFVFVPIIITITAVPVSISGFGVREGAFVLLFGLTGIPPQIATSISFLWFLSIATASLIGLGEYIRYKKKNHR